jgi:hypothetical protein
VVVRFEFLLYPEDEGNISLRNVNKLLLYYKVSCLTSRNMYMYIYIFISVISVSFPAQQEYVYIIIRIANNI